MRNNQEDIISVLILS